MGRFVSAGTSDAGNVRGNNEDRVYIDEARGIYLVVDGMGGQAAGEEAAEIAVKTVRSRLERQTENAEQRVREAIALANNAIYEAASGNPEWHGMACVLTLALVEDSQAVVGHVGDSRAYQIRGGRIEKITRDHSPVGEREDAGELSEEAAMRHPRRNEVFRDVGSTPRTPDDDDFIDIQRIPVPEDSALLLCSDGLSDVVPSKRILQVIEENANDCEAAVKILVRAAVADGKDNVSVVLLEGVRFAESIRNPAPVFVSDVPEAPKGAPKERSRAIYFVGGLLAAAAVWGVATYVQPAKAVSPGTAKTIHVAPTGADYSSIPQAMDSAASGDTIELAAGIYPDKILLKNSVTVRAVPTGGATVDSIMADAVTGASLVGIRVGSAGLELHNSDVHINDVETTGKIVFTGASTGSLRGSKVVESVVVRDSSSPEIVANYVKGDVQWLSTAPPKLDANGIQGDVFFHGAPPVGLLDNNVLSGGKKAIRVVK